MISLFVNCIFDKVMKTLQKYKPQTAKIVPWEEIEERYIDLISQGLKLESILALVQFIRTNQLDKRLFAYTSMAKLIITIYNPGVIAHSI